MIERMVCPKHNKPCTVPTYKNKWECPDCVAEVQRRLDRIMEKPR